jgi:DNA repair protein RecO (recombination protein O)
MRARHSRATGVLLRARNLGEADRVCTFLTYERGKIDAIAKGVRRGRNSFAGRLEFMNEVSLELHHGRNLDVMTSADVIASHFDAIVAPDAFATASLIAEYIDACCLHEQPLPEVYLLLCGVLAAFERTAQPMQLLPRFELRLLHAIGLAPPLDTCVCCDTVLDACRHLWLDVENGGIACGSCRRVPEGVIELTALDLENLRALARPVGGPLPVTTRARPQSVAVIERLLFHHLGSRPHVQVALDMLRGSVNR